MIVYDVRQTAKILDTDIFPPITVYSYPILLVWPLALHTHTESGYKLAQTYREWQ